MEAKILENNIIKAKKLHMSQVFTVDGKVLPVTVVKVLQELTETLQDQKIIITGSSKGKGFTGPMKRWNFKGGPATRGQSDKPRAHGSIGAQTPGRVFKGKKMAGRHGNKKVTIKGSRIVDIDLKNGNLFILGPVPGAKNSEIQIKLI